MFIPHTSTEEKEMLARIGVSSVRELLNIPQDLAYPHLDLPPALTEAQLTAHIKSLGALNKPVKNFIGAGCYEHFIPAAINALSSRGEFLTAYTPYQAEASQGTLQTIYEFQSCICALTDMDVSNASHYDGATAMAEAVLACVRINGRQKVLISSALHPHYKEVLHTYLQHFPQVSVQQIPCQNGVADKQAVEKMLDEQTSCLVLANPNFYGQLEDAQTLGELAHAKGALFVYVFQAMSLGLLRTPGSYGADFAVGEGQAFGNAMHFGGPGLGLFACKDAYKRQMPGRIVGIAKDKDGKRAFVLTLQAREQHIRREKAASNICSNEALCALNAVIYLTLMGPQGLKETAELNVERAHQLADLVSKIDGFSLKFTGPFFNEFVLQCPVPAKKLVQKLAKKGFGVYALEEKELQNCLLLCATETKTEQDLQDLAQALRGI